MFHALFAAVALVALYGFATMFANGDQPKASEALPGKVYFWAVAACALVGFLLTGWVGFWFALAWWGWRTAPALFPASASAPTTSPALAQTALRHLVAAAAAAMVALVMHLPMGHTMLVFAVWTAGAVAASWAHGHWQAQIDALPGEAHTDPATFFDMVHGAWFGLAVALVTVHG